MSGLLGLRLSENTGWILAPRADDAENKDKWPEAVKRCTYTHAKAPNPFE